MAELDKFYTPTVDDLVNANLRVRRNGLIQRGVENPNVTTGSDHYVYARALALNLAPAYQNLAIMADQQMPDSATGDDLVRQMDIYGIEVPAAAGATGNIVFAASASSLVPTGKQLIDEIGQVYEVVTGGTYDDEDEIPIRGVSTGVATEHVEGDALQWVGGAPGFADTVALVAPGGLTNGSDEANDSSNRSLLYSHLRNPPGGGNWMQVIAWAKEASPAVYSAFVYPALNGPATVGLCVLGKLSYDGSQFVRHVAESERASVDTYVSAQLDARAHVHLTTQTPKFDEGATLEVDVAIGLSLPAAIGAGGPGGGWVNAVPWPVLLGTATYVYVDVVTDSTHLTLSSDDAGTTPSALNLVDGVTEIAWFSPQAWVDGDDCIKTSTVIAHGGTTGALTVTLSEPLAGVQVDDMIFPSCEHAEEYAQAFIAAMGNMGPGQWYPNLALVPQAARQPLVVRQQPSDMVSSLLKSVSDTGEEVEDIAYLYRSDTAPPAPGSTTNSPIVIVPSGLGFFDKIP
jgi:uncharacterized phage protein gp47/JayE